MNLIVFRFFFSSVVLLVVTCCCFSHFLFSSCFAFFFFNDASTVDCILFFMLTLGLCRYTTIITIVEDGILCTGEVIEEEGAKLNSSKRRREVLLLELYITPCFFILFFQCVFVSLSGLSFGQHAFDIAVCLGVLQPTVNQSGLHRKVN